MLYQCGAPRTRFAEIMCPRRQNAESWLRALFLESRILPGLIRIRSLVVMLFSEFFSFLSIAVLDLKSIFSLVTKKFTIPILHRFQIFFVNESILSAVNTFWLFWTICHLVKRMQFCTKMWSISKMIFWVEKLKILA